MTAQLNQFTFTVEEYYKLAEVGIIKDTDRVELINGQLITMSPINSTHAGMVNRLCRLVNKVLDQMATITPQNPIKLSEYSEPEPDIVIARFRSDDYISGHPTAEDIYVVIEISDTTLEKDREIKKTLYANANIPEYWIINLVDKQIEIHRQPKNGEYHFKQIISEPGRFSCESIQFELDFNDVFK